MEALVTSDAAKSGLEMTPASVPMARIPEADIDHVLRHTVDVWPALRGARIFITGGTGFFGIWLLESLARANTHFDLGIRATVLSRDPSRFYRLAHHLAEEPFYEWLQGDVTDFAFPAGRFTHVIHAATDASARLNQEHPLVMFDTIVAGTRRVLDFASASGARDLLLTSSGAVQGAQPPEMTHLAEDYVGGPPINEPSSAYAEGKRASEFLCAVYSSTSGLRPRIARCFAFVGPYLPFDAHFAVGNFLADALAGRDIIIQGDGRPYRSYLYAADLAVWLWTLLVRGTPNRPYNIGSEEAITIQELAELIRVQTGVSGVNVRVLGTQGNELAPRYVPDTSRARKELRLLPFVPLDEAISRTSQWARHIQSSAVVACEVSRL